MDYAILLIVATVIVLFWHLLKRSVAVAEKLALRTLNDLESESKIVSMNKRAQWDIKEAVLKKAIANTTALEALDF